jgi:hypothetical protein
MAFFKELIVKITGDSSGLQRETQKAQGVISGFEGGLKKLGAGVAAAFAVREIVNFGKASVAAFDEAAKSQAKLLSAMKGNEEATKRLVAISSSLQSKSLFDDETIQNAQMFLATMKLTESQITRITPVIMDFATKMRTDLQSSASVVSKTIGSSVNALARYGIEVTGAAGSTERFESALAGLTKQVGGLSTAATGAGVSGLTQMKNLIDDIKEKIGQIIAIPLNPFLTKLKEIAELRMGTTQRNAASDIISEGRAIIARSASIEEGKKALEEYIKVQEKEQKNLEWEKKSIAKTTTPFKEFTSRLLPSGLVQGMSPSNKVEYEKYLASINAQIDAQKELNKLASDPAAIEKLYQESHASLEVTKNLGYYIELNKSLTTEQLTATSQRAMQIKSEIEANQKIIDQYTKVVEAERDKYQYEKLSEEDKQSRLEKTIKILEKINNLQYVKGGEKYKLPGTENRKLAPNKNQDLVGTPVDIDPEALNSLTKAIELTDTLNDSLRGLGDELSRGADNWADFGKMALNALKGLVAGIIAKGVALAITNSIEVSSALGPFAVGIGAAAGGLAAGAFSTLVPSFAGGGIVDRPTIAMIGDNPGRKEAVIPSELWDKMGGSNGSAKLEAYISGKQIKFVLDQYNSSQSRMGG